MGDASDDPAERPRLGAKAKVPETSAAYPKLPTHSVSQETAHAPSHQGQSGSSSAAPFAPASASKRSSGTSKRTCSASRRAFPPSRRRNDCYPALAYTRARPAARALGRAPRETYSATTRRTVCYLSAEFLLGPQLGNNLLNLGIEARRAQAMAELGLDLDELLEQEEEPGLGNGGLGRLAACYMDSLATLADPGDRLRHPLRVRHLRPADPRRLAGRGDRQVAAPRQPVGDRAPGDRVRREARRPHRGLRPTTHGRYRVRWMPERVVQGRRLRHARSSATASTTRNLLRLWKARGGRVVRLRRPSTLGDYYGAVEEKVDSENITKVLYPNDETDRGQAAAPRAAVLLRLLRAAGHDPHPPAACAEPLDGFARRSTRSSSTTPTRRSPWPS